MDVLNYLNENSQYQNAEDFQQQQQQQFKEYINQLSGQYKEAAENVVLPAVDLLARGKQFYNKITGGIESAAKEGESVVNKAISEGGGLLDNALSVGRNVLNVAESNIGEGINMVRGIGSKISNNMRQNAFDIDPEESIANAGENMGMLDKVQSIFRNPSSLVSEGEKTASSIAENVGKTASSVAENVGETVAKGVGEGVGSVISEAVPVFGEAFMIGQSIADLIKGTEVSRTPPPAVEAFAAPALEHGI
jgi:phage-related protein